MSNIGHFSTSLSLRLKLRRSGPQPESHTGHRSFCCHALCPHCKPGTAAASRCGQAPPGSSPPAKGTLSLVPWPQHLVSGLHGHHAATSRMRSCHLRGRAGSWTQTTTSLRTQRSLSSPRGSNSPRFQWVCCSLLSSRPQSLHLHPLSPTHTPVIQLNIH